MLKRRSFSSFCEHFFKSQFFESSLKILCGLLSLSLLFYFVVDFTDYERKPDVGQLLWKLLYRDDFISFSKDLKFSLGSMLLFWGMKIFGLVSLELWKALSIAIACGSFFYLSSLVKKYYGLWVLYLFLSLSPLFFLEPQVNHFFKWVILTYPLSVLFGTYFIDFFLRYEKKRILKLSDLLFISFISVINFRLCLIWGAWGLSQILKRLFLEKDKKIFSKKDKNIYFLGAVLLSILIATFCLSPVNYLSLAGKDYARLLFKEEDSYFSFFSQVFKIFSLKIFPGLSSFFAYFFSGLLLFVFLEVFKKLFWGKKVSEEHLILLALFFFLALLFYAGRYPFGDFRYLLFGLPLLLLSLSTALSKIPCTLGGKLFFPLLIVLQIFSMKTLFEYSEKKIEKNRLISLQNREFLGTLFHHRRSERALLSEFWSVQIINSYLKTPYLNSLSRELIVKDRLQKRDFKLLEKTVKQGKPLVLALTTFRVKKSFNSLRAYLQKKGYHQVGEQKFPWVSFFEYEKREKNLAL